VRGAATRLLGHTVAAPPAKVEALSTGALQWLVDVAADADTFDVDCRSRAIAGAGNIAYAAASSLHIAPFTAMLFAHVVRVAEQPWLLGPTEDSEEASDEAAMRAADEEAELLYSAVFACAQLVPFADVRPLFEQHARALKALAAAVQLRAHTVGGIASLLRHRILPELARRPAAALSADVSRLRVVSLSVCRPGTDCPDTFRYGQEGPDAATPPQGGGFLSGAWRADERFVCASCGASGTRGFKRCSGCLEVRYCDAACQAMDWPAHRPACHARKKEMAAGKP
jgi:hypothetical protein